MKVFIRRFFAVILSLAIIIAPTIQQANAASSWTVSSSVSSGSRSIVTVTKSGYKSAVNIAPTAGRLGLRLIKGANTLSVAYAVLQLAGKAVDWVLEPENNAVRYTVPNGAFRAIYSIYDSGNQPTAEIACNVLASKVYASNLPTVTVGGSPYACRFNGNPYGYITKGSLVVRVPVDKVAAQVIKNADAGHAESRAATRETATEMVIGGQFDQDLLAGAVPTNDTRPLVPSVPISGGGNVAPGVGVGSDDGLMTGGDLGKAADDARVAADNARKAAQAAKDAATAAANDARVAADKANDLVNSAVDQAIKDAAKATADAAAQAAKDAAAVSDAAVKAANDRAAAAERAAEAAASAAKDAAAQAAKDLDAAKAAGDAAAIAAAEKAKAAADAALADAKAKQEAAEKAAEKAKAEAAKPFELPAFCSWAGVVCDLADWLKREPEMTPETPLEIDEPISDFDTDKKYIEFTGSCPPKYTASLSVMGATAPFEFDYTPICTVMSYLKPFIVGAGFIAAAYIIAGHSRGSKD